MGNANMLMGDVHVFLAGMQVILEKGRVGL